ncbi:hypothetical protein [Prescottella defluvii]|uniref:hypothetical protein n=2 Tax=Prescottella defluvii TaxID=1323361 RepID=UPI0004F2D013|nr:hypothetical protein [Prescottella defluvii]
MRPRTCLAALLLPLALTSCGDTEPDQPTIKMEIAEDEPPVFTPPPTAQLLPNPDTGALAPTDIENAVRSQAATDLTTSGVPAAIDDVQCLTGGPPLIYPATTLCHATSNSLDMTLTYGIAITDNQGHISIMRW